MIRRKIVLGGTMSDGTAAGFDTLSDVIYFIDDTAVAIIENHELTAIAPGTTTLHAFIDGIHIEIEVIVSLLQLNRLVLSINNTVIVNGISRNVGDMINIVAG